MKPVLLSLGFILSIFNTQACIKNQESTVTTEVSNELQLSTFIKDAYAKLTKNLEGQELVKAQLAFLKQDFCFATNVASGCKLKGAELKITVPLDKFYGFASIGHLESIDGKNPDGKPNLTMMPAEIGVGFAYKHNESIKSIYEVGYNTSGDKEYFGTVENGNYNEGLRLKAYLQSEVGKKFTVGAGIVHDRSQNSSHKQHHGFKDKKPKMSYTNGEVYASYKLTPNIEVRAKVTKMIQKPEEKYTSSAVDGGSPNRYPETNYGIEFEYKFIN